MNYIGVDCHISTLDFAVVNEKGTVSQRAKVNTGVKEFMAFVKNIPKPRKIFIYFLTNTDNYQRIFCS